MNSIGSIYCIGRNYAEHAAELGNSVPEDPIVFLKSTSSLRVPEHGPLAFPNEQFHHEIELVVKIASDLPLGHQGTWHDVEALTLGIDLTRRQTQNELKKNGHPWTLAKSFAGSAIIGTFVPNLKQLNRENLHFTLTVNGDLRQQGETRDMIFSVPQLITYLCSFNLLKKGDVIFTGTPKGVGPIKKGDRFEMTSPDLNVQFKGEL